MPGAQEIWFGVHIGPAAGQNISHLHYHVLHPIREPGSTGNDEEMIAFCKSSKLRLLEHKGMIAVAGGQRVGQCLIVPLEIRGNSIRIWRECCPRS